MWALAAAWWLQGSRSISVALGAIAVGALGTAIAIRGMRERESRTRDASAAILAALVGVALALSIRAAA